MRRILSYNYKNYTNTTNTVLYIIPDNVKP